MSTKIFKALFAKRETVWGKSYKDLPIKSDCRVHDAAFGAIAEKFGAAKGLKVLDIATGTGAFARRLLDNFQDWTVEINDFEDQALIDGLKKHKVDLNSDFGGKFSEGKYDVVVAIEILEHLENPWHFMRESRKLLREGGLLVLSTPNVDSVLDRIVYLKEGYSFYFGEGAYVHSGGHITPVPDWLLRKAAAGAGYGRVELLDAVNTAPHIGRLNTLKLFLVMIFLRFYMRNANERSISVYLCS